jgi:YfiH family protein
MTPLRETLAAAGLDWIVPEWPAPPDVRAFSTTRNRGAIGDSIEQAVLPWLPSSPRWLRQVHGADVDDADQERPSSEPPRADAIFTRAANTVCAVQTADCLPVLFADRGDSAVAAAHAGWRGLAAGVLENTVRALPVQPSKLMAWLGPAIGPQAFEVGGEVRKAFLHESLEAVAAFKPGARDGKWMCDLYALARLRLRAAGVERTYGGGWCTHSDPARFFSFRRDGECGRMASLIWLAGPRSS